jgi:integrase
MNPAVLRQQMGHSSAVMTERYTGEIPLDNSKRRFPKWNWRILELLENGRGVPAVA